MKGLLDGNRMLGWGSKENLSEIHCAVLKSARFEGEFSFPRNLDGSLAKLNMPRVDEVVSDVIEVLRSEHIKASRPRFEIHGLAPEDIDEMAGEEFDDNLQWMYYQLEAEIYDALFGLGIAFCELSFWDENHAEVEIISTAQVSLFEGWDDEDVELFDLGAKWRGLLW